MYDFAFSCALVKVSQASHPGGVAQGGESERFSCFVFDSYHFASVGVAKWMAMDEGSLCVMLRHPLPLPAISFGRLRSSQKWGQHLQAKQRMDLPLFATNVDFALSLTLYDSFGGRVQGAFLRNDRTSVAHRIVTSDARLARRDAIVVADGQVRPGKSRSRNFTLRASAFTREDVQVRAYVDLLVRVS
tara:strand:+ start:335 stop:898 length:564 start_codon:yes stop_codon:yes gene_type:complete